MRVRSVKMYVPGFFRQLLAGNKDCLGNISNDSIINASASKEFSKGKLECKSFKLFIHLSRPLIFSCVSVLLFKWCKHSYLTNNKEKR